MFKAISRLLSARNYPMLWVALCTICGILLWSETSHDFSYILYGVSFLALLVDLIFRRPQFLVFSLIILGAYLLAQESTAPKPPISYNQEAVFVGTLCSNPIKQGKWHKARVSVMATEDSAGYWYDRPYDIFVGLSNVDTILQVDDTICLKGTLRKIEGDYGKYVFRDGIVGQVYSYQSALFGTAGKTFNNILQGLRDNATHKIMTLDSTMTDAAATATSMVVGDRNSLNPNITETYRNTGTSHLLAISGLHLGIVVVLLNLVLGSLKFLGRRGRVIYGVIIILALWFYALFSGMALSVQRATIMFTLFQTALLMHRSVTSINTLSTAAVAILLWSPYSLYNIGFQLSFMALVGIFIFFRPVMSFIKSRNTIVRLLFSALVVSLSAQIGVAPILAFHFGEVAWFGMVLSLLIWITVPIIIFSTLLYLVSSIDLLGYIALYTTSLQNKIFGVVSHWDFTVISNIRLSLIDLSLCYVAIFMLGIWVNERAQKYSRYKIHKLKL